MATLAPMLPCCGGVRETCINIAYNNCNKIHNYTESSVAAQMGKQLHTDSFRTRRRGQLQLHAHTHILKLYTKMSS